MTFLRSTLYALWFFGSLAIIGFAWLPFAAFSRKAAVHGIRTWAGLQVFGLHAICGARTEVRGLEHMPPGGGIIAMKHQSTYDTVAPFTFIDDPAYILKQELLKQPIFGTYATRARMIPIDRGGHAKALRAMMARAREETEHGRRIVIFPEGTRQDVDAPTRLKSGVAGMYLDMNAPCVPVALNTGLCWKGSGFLRRPGLIIFEFLPPIMPGLPRDEFMARLTQTLDSATVRLVAEGRAAQGLPTTVVRQAQ